MWNKLNKLRHIKMTSNLIKDSKFREKSKNASKELLNEGGLTINWSRKLKDKGNAFNAV